jgi:hypothetical protein
VQGNFDDDRSLARALEGVDVMLLAGRDSPDSASQHQRVLAHARRAEVRHIVKLSAIGASPESPIALMRETQSTKKSEKVQQTGPSSSRTSICRICCAPQMRFGAKDGL